MARAKEPEVEQELVTNDTWALRHRPHRLEHLVGQQQTVDDLRGMFARKQVPNAICITGISGVGKTTIARMIAQYFNCAKGTACGECEVCLMMDGGKLPPDYQETNVGENGGIDLIRGIIEGAKMRPRHKLRIVFIDEIHRLSLAAANALLGPLESPPPKTMWILATTDPDKIPNSAAVLGRCGRLNLNAVNPQAAAQGLTRIAKIERARWLDEECALAIGRAANGHMRNAVQMMESIHNKIAVMEKAPRGRRLVKLVQAMVVETTDSDADRVASRLLTGIYTFKPEMVQRAILDSEDYIQLINKLLYMNYYIVNRLMLGKQRHPKVWGSRSADEVFTAIRAKVTFDDAVAVHKALGTVRERAMSFAVGAEHILTGTLTSMAFPDD